MMMKTSTIEKYKYLSPRAAITIAGLLGLGIVAGCGFVGGFSDDNVPEGDRCNPLESHNDCSSGAVCTQASTPSGAPFGQGSGPVIPFCPENYCCSVDSNGNINSTNPNCQPGCNGGAASICTAADNADAGACLFAACIEDASLSSCAAEFEPSTGPVEDGGSDASGSDGSSTPEGSSPTEAGDEAEAASPSTPDAGSEAEAASPADAGGDSGDAGAE
jgi:hypothetical protein